MAKTKAEKYRKWKRKFIDAHIRITFNQKPFERKQYSCVCVHNKYMSNIYAKI